MEMVGENVDADVDVGADADEYVDADVFPLFL